jgi:hypothetical protein
MLSSRLALSRAVPQALGIVAALVLLLATATTPASAGTLHMQLGVDPTGCIAQSWFATGMAGRKSCASALSIFDYGGGWEIFPGSLRISAGAAGQWQINAPAGITIDSVTLPYVYSSDLVGSGSYGWRAGDYWAGGSNTWGPGTTQLSEGVDYPLNSGYYGFKLYCYASSCNNQGYLQVPEVDVTANENQGPGLTAVASNNLWYQAGHYVWNPSGDPWSIELSASDPSGVCNMWAYVDTTRIDGPTATPATDSFLQCPSPVDWSPGQGASVDTNQYVPAGASGSMSLELDATNAAGATSGPSETLQVDNVRPAVSLRTSNDPNASVWVGHAVSVDVAASAGPSGVGGMNCAVDGHRAAPYPTGGLTIDGNGIHTVSCTTWNQAVGPQGQPNAGTSSLRIAIDAAPPSVSFEPPDPANPTQLVINTSDNESGVAGGSIAIAPAGASTWRSLPTSFDGEHLLATLDDAGLHGPYTVRATSCDQVGNCASTTESLTLPLRLPAVSDVSFAKIETPARVVRKRVLVGFHYRRERRHGHLVKIRVGGHYRRIRIVIGANQRCGHRRVRTGPRRWRQVNVCRAIKLHIVAARRVAHGRPVTVHGLLVTGPGVPIAHGPVQVLTAPDNGLNQFGLAAAATTSSNGSWTAKLPAGPSRIIRAVYGGSATVLPASGTASVSVPARIELSITPRTIPWDGAVTIHGRLVGGYVPPDGVALRVLVRYPRNPRPTPLLALRTDARGRFTIRWSYGAGQGIATYPMTVATTATESDYPFAGASGSWLRVTFGANTPPQQRHHHRKR